MHITLKLFATLTDYLPTESRYTNIVELEVADAPPSRGHCPHNLPPAMVHLVLVNGRYIAPEDRTSHALQPGDARDLATHRRWLGVFALPEA